jgi:hypothetical protein
VLCLQGNLERPGQGRGLDFRHLHGFGYVMNRMNLGATGDRRSADLIHATLAAVDGG